MLEFPETRGFAGLRHNHLDDAPSRYSLDCGPGEDSRIRPLRRSARGKFPELEQMPEWLARGYAGEMQYLADPRRSDPRRPCRES